MSEVTQLGAAFKKAPQADMGSLLEALASAVEASIMSRLQIDRKPPVVNVPPSVTHVAAPNVTVNPEITVQERPHQPAQVTVQNSVDMSEYADELHENTVALKAIHLDLEAIFGLLNRPVTKTVHRASGLIDTVTETRGR